MPSESEIASAYQLWSVLLVVVSGEATVDSDRQGCELMKQFDCFCVAASRTSKDYDSFLRILHYSNANPDHSNRHNFTLWDALSK